MAVSLHHEDSEEAVGLSQAGIEHLDKDSLKLTVVNSQLLMGLELFKVLFIDSIDI
jgi:hypothetical protein